MASVKKKPSRRRVAPAAPAVVSAAAPVRVEPRVMYGMPVPRSVAIVAMGESNSHYVRLVASAGDRRVVADETWVINAAASIFAHDRVFLMDDLKEMVIPDAERGHAALQGMLNWIGKHDKPIYLSTTYPDLCPAGVEYPLADVVAKIKPPYLNTTVAYAVAFGMLLGIPKMNLYGCDFTYPDNHTAESGRACVEFLLGLYIAAGGKIALPKTTTLMDAYKGDNGLYGYSKRIRVHHHEDGSVSVDREAKVP